MYFLGFVWNILSLILLCYDGSMNLKLKRSRKLDDFCIRHVCFRLLEMKIHMQCFLCFQCFQVKTKMLCLIYFYFYDLGNFGSDTEQNSRIGAELFQFDLPQLDGHIRPVD